MKQAIYFLILLMFVTIQIDTVHAVWDYNPSKVVPAEIKGADSPPKKIITVEMDRVELKPHQHSAMKNDYYLPENTYTKVVIKNTGKYPIRYEMYSWHKVEEWRYLVEEGIVPPYTEKTLVNVVFDYTYQVNLIAKGPGILNIPGIYRHKCKATAVMYIRLPEGAKIRTARHEHLP